MKIIKIIPVVVAIALMSSCKTPTNINYFQDLKDGTTLTLPDNKGVRLKPEDKLSILVKSKNATITNMLNLAQTNQIVGYSESSSLSQSKGTAGYVVDNDGNIDFPIIGQVHVAGLTRDEVAAKIRQEIEQAEVAKDIVVSVEFLNLHFAVLGEVRSPHDYYFGREKLTITDAIAMAGDLTLYGLRENVMVIRNEDGHQKTYEVNLLDAQQLLQSPAFYIQQNDIIYVQPTNYRKRQSTANGNQFQSASLWVSIASMLTTLSVLVFK